MLVSVQPTTYRSPADGSEITINQVEVRCVSYTLNVGASAYFDLQNVSEVTKAREVPNPDYVPASLDEDGNPVAAQGEPTITEEYTETVTTSYGLNGNNALTDEQFAGWGNDDAYFGACIVENLGLTVAAS